MKKKAKNDAESLKKSAPPPLPFERYMKKSSKKEDKAKNEESITVKEALEMIRHMRKVQDEINAKLEEIAEKTGVTTSFIKNYLETSTNFNKEEWDNFQKQRKEMIDSIKPQSNATQQEGPKRSKERRSKTMGARRKWIPMK